MRGRVEHQGKPVNSTTDRALGRHSISSVYSVGNPEREYFDQEHPV